MFKISIIAICAVAQERLLGTVVVPVGGQVLELDNLVDQGVLLIQEFLEPVFVSAERINTLKCQANREGALTKKGLRH